MCHVADLQAAAAYTVEGESREEKMARAQALIEKVSCTYGGRITTL